MAYEICTVQQFVGKLQCAPMPLGKPVPFAVNEVLYPVDKCMVGRGFVKIFGYPVIDKSYIYPLREISTWVPGLGL